MWVQGIEPPSSRRATIQSLSHLSSLWGSFKRIHHTSTLRSRKNKTTEQKKKSKYDSLKTLSHAFLGFPEFLESNEEFGEKPK